MCTDFQQIGRQGFTLIELSIVLVIIGLIVGGVLVGKDMISAAEIRKQITDLEKFSTSENTFRLKYNALAGDLTGDFNTNYGFSTCPVPFDVGAGNGLINDGNGAMPLIYTYCEPLNYFQNLSQAGLTQNYILPVAGHWIVGEAFPRMVMNPSAGITVASANGYIWFFLGISDGNTTGDALVTHLSTHGVLSPVQAFGIDQKRDDGIPSTGTVEAVVPNLGTGALDGTLDVTPAQCVLNIAATAYNVTKNDYTCRLFVRDR